MGTGGKLLLWDMERVIMDKFGMCLSTAFESCALVGSLQLLVAQPGSWAGRRDSAPGRLGELRGWTCKGASNWPCRAAPRLQWSEHWRSDKLMLTHGTNSASHGHQLGPDRLHRLLDAGSYK